MAARKKAIEFLPQEEWQKGTLGHLLKWALTVGRFIVVFTELIVILAFLSRFKFDRDLTDLNEAVSQKKAIVEAAADFEQDFLFLQKQLETIAGLKKNRPLLGGLPGIDSQHHRLRIEAASDPLGHVAL